MKDRGGWKEKVDRERERVGGGGGGGVNGEREVREMWEMGDK